jgi:hypothetical protein
MRGRIPLGNAARGFWQLQRPGTGPHARRAIQISATPTIESPIFTGDVLGNSIDASTDPAGGDFKNTGLKRYADGWGAF